MGKDGKKQKISAHKVLEIAKKLDERAKIDGVQYALIGGGLFALLGWQDDTEDMDFAADDYINLPFAPQRLVENPWESKDQLGVGHYVVDDVGVDWMPQGKAGSRPLFEGAIASATLNHHGLWVADPHWAMAIKLYAGREKDVEFFNECWDNDLIDGKLVMEIIQKHCPNWRKP